MTSALPDNLDYVKNLNTAQRKAVTHPPDLPLQILAGPGSGKTRVLTCRVAHLVRHHSIPPNQICAVTFTNKAANEMQERLKKLIGPDQTAQLVMGTFHALCGRYLRRYGQVIGLQNNFSIVDTEAGKRLVANVLRDKAGDMARVKVTLKDMDALSRISTLKAKGVSPASAHALATHDNDDYKIMIAEIYEGYEEELRRHNSLDFDDLLVYGVQLFKASPGILRNIRHILVDEFQDTNTMQYELMQRFAFASGAVSIVGDPDQSIYGWRAAEVENLNRMSKDFPKTTQIFLEENYRSTGAILACSLAIVSQDKDRIDKGLYTSHPKGAQPVNRAFAGEQAESAFIASEIKRLIAYSGGALGFNDFVVLLRYNALSRVIESALQKEAIPNRVLAGQKFFDRLEIKDLLAYLQLVDNPHFGPALLRVINVPRRAVGDKTAEQIMDRAKAKNISPMEIIEKIAAGRIPDTKPPVKNKVGPFLKVIRELRKLAREGTSVPDLLQRLLDLIKYEDWLRRTQQDWEMRWENVRELMNYASQIDHEQAPSLGLPDFPDEVPPPVNGAALPTADEDDEIIDLTMDQSIPIPENEPPLLVDETDLTDESMRDVMKDTPLRRFLEVSMLATDGDTQEQESKEKVTISTCHAAKGLEWPVVFIPACENGVFPFYRSDDTEEERRLLYVACTRAQVFLYFTHTTQRMSQGQMRPTVKSDFLTAAIKSNRSVVTPKTPQMTYDDCAIVCKIIDRPLVSRDVVNAKVAEFVRLHPPSDSGRTTPASSQDALSNGGAVVPLSQGFTTGLAAHQTGSYDALLTDGRTAGAAATKAFKLPTFTGESSSIATEAKTAPLQSRSVNQAITTPAVALTTSEKSLPHRSHQPHQPVQPYRAYSAFQAPAVPVAVTWNAPPAIAAAQASVPSVDRENEPIPLAVGKKRLGMGPSRAMPSKKGKFS